VPTDPGSHLLAEAAFSSVLEARGLGSVVKAASRILPTPAVR